MKTNMKIVISLMLVFAMIASAGIISAKYRYNDEETVDIEDRFIGLWQFDPNSYNPYGENAWFFISFKEDGSCRTFGTYDGNNLDVNGKWYIDDETNYLMLLTENSSTGMDFYFSTDFRTLSLITPSMKDHTMIFNKIVIQVGPTEPIDDTDQDSTVDQPIPSAQEEPVITEETIPTDIVVMELGDTFHPGSVSGVCMLVGSIHYNCLCDPHLELYIDGELHSIQDKTVRTIPFGGSLYSGYKFDNWDTTKYENGLHELEIKEDNGRVVVEMLVIVQN